MFSAVAVNALVLEAMANRVWASTAALPNARSPQPRSNTTSPSLATATAVSGPSKVLRTDSIWESKSEIWVGTAGTGVGTVLPVYAASQNPLATTSASSIALIGT